MKKALLALTVAVATAASVFAQGSTDGTLVFKTATVQKADGSGTYNVPLFQSNGDTDSTTGLGNGNGTIAAGLLPGGVTVGLFLSGSSTPFVTGVLGTSGGGSFYVATPSPSQTVGVPGQPVGSTPTIIIRAWQGASFAAAQSTINQQWGEWTITAKPLGGTPAGGGTPITPPTLTGWGAETGNLGFELNKTVPEPSTIALGVLGVGALFLARRRK
jgi:hypothetical protein